MISFKLATIRILKQIKKILYCEEIVRYALERNSIKILNSTISEQKVI